MNISPVLCFTQASRTFESERADPLAPIALGTRTAVPRSAVTPTTTPPTITLDFMTGTFLGGSQTLEDRPTDAQEPL